MDEHVISIYYTHEHGRNIKWAKRNIVENLMVIFFPTQTPKWAIRVRNLKFKACGSTYNIPINTINFPDIETMWQEQHHSDAEPEQFAILFSTFKTEKSHKIFPRNLNIIKCQSEAGRGRIVSAFKKYGINI